MPPSGNVTTQAPPYGSYGYPGMQSAYQPGPEPHADASPSHDLYGQPNYQQYSQVSSFGSVLRLLMVTACDRLHVKGCM